MYPTLLILIALTDGAKTLDELRKILEGDMGCWPASMHLSDYTDALVIPSPDGDRTSPAIRELPDSRFELTTEGNVWLYSRPVIRFVVDHMNRVERHGLPRGESIPASRD